MISPFWREGDQFTERSTCCAILQGLMRRYYARSLYRCSSEIENAITELLQSSTLATCENLPATPEVSGENQGLAAWLT